MKVYESLIYRRTFASPFDQKVLADRTIVVSSISKSHAAPGFRAGWAVGPVEFMSQLQSVAESFLFGSQPFIADMTTHALVHPDDTAQRISTAYQQRIDLLLNCFQGCEKLRALPPDAGMFMLVDVSGTGQDGAAFARNLLDQGVAVMPGDVFGNQANAVNPHQSDSGGRPVATCRQSSGALC